MPKKTKQATADSIKEVLVSVILDRSSSMSSCWDTTISGYNEYLKGLKSDAKNTYFVTHNQFDLNMGVEITVVDSDVPVSKATELNRNNYIPRGSTPLYDAIGECVRRTDARGRGVIAVIITDGEENSSQEFNMESIKKLIAEKEKEGWTFVFLGAEIDSYADAGKIGVPVMATANYTKGQERTMYAALGQSTMERASAYKVSGSQANLCSFFDDTQKMAMDPSYASPSATTVVTTTTTTSKTGGRPAAPQSFRKPRSWRTTVSGTGRGS